MSVRFLASLLVLASIAAAGCTNTVAGAGEDISKAGQAITKSTR
jgi:predicted small secreted protein